MNILVYTAWGKFGLEQPTVSEKLLAIELKILFYKTDQEGDNGGTAV